MQDDNCKHAHTTLEGEPDIITWYLRGSYAVTIGKLLHFQGDANDRSLVKTIADNVMEHIRGLALESRQRAWQTI